MNATTRAERTRIVTDPKNPYPSVTTTVSRSIYLALEAKAKTEGKCKSAKVRELIEGYVVGKGRTK